MQSPTRALKTPWRWLALFFIALVPRLFLLRVYDVELSQDGFDAVNTLTILQTQGASAVPRELIDRFILHPLYMLLLDAWKILTPSPIDFYFAARFLSTLIACIAVIVLFELTRRAFSEIAAWTAALFLAFAPSFLWESVAILSSTLFLALYLGVLLALLQSRYRLAALLAFLSAITRYEGVVLIALVFIALVVSKPDRIKRNNWLVCIAFTLAFPFTLMLGGVVATGNAFEFLGAQSMAAIWLRFLAPGDFFKHAAFFITQYPALYPTPIVWLGIAGGIIALIWHRKHGTFLLLLTSAFYLVFFEVLVWLNYTTLETRFLMYPGLPLLVFAGIALAHLEPRINSAASRVLRFTFHVALAALVAVFLIFSYQQGDLGMRFIYNMMASQREMADELSRIVPPNQTTSLLAYTGNSGALAMFGQQYGMKFTFTDFRFAPDDNPEQFVVDKRIQYVIYPIGNAFAKAKYPYLAQFETQTHGRVTFQSILQFSTSTDNQPYSIWSVSY